MPYIVYWWGIVGKGVLIKVEFLKVANQGLLSKYWLDWKIKTIAVVCVCVCDEKLNVPIFFLLSKGAWLLSSSSGEYIGIWIWWQWLEQTSSNFKPEHTRCCGRKAAWETVLILNDDSQKKHSPHPHWFPCNNIKHNIGDIKVSWHINRLI